MNFLQRYLKKRTLRKNLKRLGKLLYLRYGKSKYYTKNQVDRTIREGKINKDITYSGYIFFLDPGVVNSIIMHDTSSYPDIEELKAEITEIFKGSDAEFSIENLMDEIRSDSDYSGSNGFGSDAGDSSGSDGGSTTD